MNETNWDDLKLFLAVARAGGLSAAARVTGTSAPTLGRRMLTLEGRLGVELFNRLPRGYTLTPQGEDLLRKAGEIEAQILPLMQTGTGKVLVKLSAGSWMTHFLCKNVPRILVGNDNARLRFISAEHVLDIARREAVIGIRNRRPDQAGLACRRLGHVDFAGYAADTTARHWIRVVGKTPSARWLTALEPDEVAVEVAAPRNALDLAKSGIGQALLPTFIGDTEAGLHRVTPRIADLRHEQWLVTHQDERFVPEVRRTIDNLYKVIRTMHGPGADGTSQNI